MNDVLRNVKISLAFPKRRIFQNMTLQGSYKLYACNKGSFFFLMQHSLGVFISESDSYGRDSLFFL